MPCHPKVVRRVIKQIIGKFSEDHNSNKLPLPFPVFPASGRSREGSDCILGTHRRSILHKVVLALVFNSGSSIQELTAAVEAVQKILS